MPSTVLDVAPTMSGTPLSMSSDEFRALGTELVNRLASHFDRLPDERVCPGVSPAQVRRSLDASRTLPARGSDPGQLIHHALDLLQSNSMFIGHPKFFGYITSGGTPIGVLADRLASAINPNVGAWKLSPMASEIEAQTVRWLAEMVDYPSDCGGLLTSGGNMANFLCIFAARAARLPWDVRSEGMGPAGVHRPLIYASPETHTWLHKAVDLAGFGTDAIRWIPTDDRQRMWLPALERQIAEDRAAGALPLIVIGSAGTTNTGAVDRLPAMATICRRHDLWFHVDGAYGAFANGVPGAPDDLHGLEEANSVAMDPHKWLYAPLDAGCALVRDPIHLRDAFSYHPPYYKFDDDAINYLDYGMENSRSFRALKVWLSLQQAGRDGYREMISEDIRKSRELVAALREHPLMEVFTQSLSVCTFRYLPKALRATAHLADTQRYLNDLNRQVLTDLERSGLAFLSQAMVDGNLLLRACVLNFRTTTADVRALPAIIEKVGEDAHRNLARQHLAV